MGNFMTSFNVVFPIFVMMAIGYFIKNIKFIDDNTVKKNNALIFKLFLPMMLFKNVYESDISSVFNPKLIMFSLISSLIIIAVLFVIVPVFEKDNRKRGVLIQGMFRSNFVIFGVPVTEALCGSEVTGSAAVLVAIIVPVFNFFSVIALAVFDTKKADFKSVLLNIIKNPLIIASALGLGALLFGIRLPHVIEESVSYLAKVTTPLALMMLGASINFKRIGDNLVSMTCAVLVKLVIIPLIFVGAGIFVFGFRGAELAILLALFATPPAVSSFTMAQQMGSDDELAGLLVMFGTSFCLITMFVWIYIIKTLGLI
ncbi:MAG: AEC family transporter [Clostridia bacterium]|nr:AEC family transporter [Clostridia bacterium]